MPPRNYGHPRRIEAEALLRAGQHPAAVAASVGATRRSVESWRKALGLPPLPIPGRSAGASAQAVLSEAARMLEEKRPVREIAAQLGVTPARIRQIRQELGLSRRG